MMDFRPTGAVGDMTATSYGKSMYGGWYLNYTDMDGNYRGIRRDTLKAVCEWMNITVHELGKSVMRQDN